MKRAVRNGRENGWKTSSLGSRGFKIDVTKTNCLPSHRENLYGSSSDEFLEIRFKFKFSPNTFIQFIRTKL